MAVSKEDNSSDTTLVVCVCVFLRGYLQISEVPQGEMSTCAFALGDKRVLLSTTRRFPWHSTCRVGSAHFPNMLNT